MSTTLELKKKFIYFESDRDSTSGGRGQRERERDRILSRLCTASTDPDVGLDPMNPCGFMT